MASALTNLRELLAYAATRPSHDRADRIVAEELAVGPDELGLPPTVELRWLGVAGFALSCAGTTVLVDPYVTRLGLGDFVRRRVVRSDLAAIDRYVPRADAIVLGHTHFDHALDAPAIARRDGAMVYGSLSAKRLMAMHGMADRAMLVGPHQQVEIGPFTITFVPSVHSKLLLGRTIPSGGEITCEHVGELTPQAYCCGQVWGIHIEVDGATIYHQGSADLLDDEMVHREVDVFLCGIAGRQVTPDYVPRILGTLEPKTVVITHHDDFFVPLDQGRFAFGVDVAGFPEEVARVSADFRVVTLA
jgi:L-ascorbate metabolism protein UlaG (beta-lactamase superfamily)